MAFNIQNVKKTKIIATLGPACDNRETIRALILAGTDMFRLNASHRSDPPTIKKNVRLIRDVAEELKRPVAIFLDLQGPKIRVGKFKEKKVLLKKGTLFTLTMDPIDGDEKQASVSYPGLVNDVNIGDPIFIDDGKIKLSVKERNERDIVCDVIQGGHISSHKGFNLPATQLRISALTDKDRKDVHLAIENNMDYIALSFVSSEKDVEALRTYLHENGSDDIRIIAKIERPHAIDRIVPIIEASDAVMVARGDLGVEIGVENVPRAQKMIIREANRRIKPVIVATQMLESTILSLTATRAEVSDVANAIYDRCDAVMLSGETAIGVDPANAVRIMHNICLASDLHMVEIKREERFRERDFFTHKSVATSFCKAADQIAEENKANAIMAFTSSGNTPLIASKLNSTFPIIAPTDNERVCRRMALYRGVLPMMMPKPFKDIHRWTEMIMQAVKESKRLELVNKKDIIVVTAGIPIGKSNGINSIRLVTV